MRCLAGLLGGGLCACALGGTTAARIAPATMMPLVDPGYRPSDAAEGAVWQDCARVEENLAGSDPLIAAPPLHRYVSDVIQTLLRDRARDTRLYLVHDPSFNASMWPNGMMVVHSGLLIRMRNEAQLAAVLGHESGHYLRRHSIAAHRDKVRKTGMMAFVAAGSNVMAGAAAIAGGDGRSWADIVNNVNGSLYASMFTFDRQQESEADAFGVRLLAEAGYTPDAAAAVWQQLIEERRASAAARSKHYRARVAAFSTHPPNEERMTDLTLSAQELATHRSTGHDGGVEWRRAIAPVRSALLDEQVKQNDPGASLYLINAHAADGWDGTLCFYQGETFRLRDAPGDDALAAQAFAAAVTLGNAPAAAWRAHGYAQIKAGRSEDGRHALARYLDLEPQAYDAAMVRFAISQ